MNPIIQQMAEKIDPAAFLPTKHTVSDQAIARSSAYRKARECANIVRLAWDQWIKSEGNNG